MTPSPTPMHQIVSSNIYSALSSTDTWEHLGCGASRPDRTFGSRQTTCLIPDIIFVAQRPAAISLGPKTIDAPPDLVVEILSPGTRRRDLTTKRALYARFGVQEYWIVDPDARTVTVLALAGDNFEPVPRGEGGAIASRVLPGFTLALNDVFAGVEQ